MKFKILIVAALYLLVIACGNRNNENPPEVPQAPSEASAPATPEAPPAPPEAPAPPPVKEFKTKTGKVFLVEESHPKGMTLSDI